MTRLGKLWTDAVAYIALVLGAGLSIAGNVADTYRTRGPATDELDVVMAVAWPALVVLMVEIFVSPRWVGLAWPMQILRWVGTLAIGGMAMRVSWVHLNDLMASRGQKADVATLGPLAIDALAIMATALILAGRRGHGHVATFDPYRPLAATDSPVANWAAGRGTGGHLDPMATDTMDSWAADIDGQGHVRPHTDTDIEWPRTPATPPSFLYETDMAVVEPEPVATRPEGDYTAWQNGYEDGLTEAGRELVTEAEGILKQAEPLPKRDRLAMPESAAEIIREWGGSRADLVKHVSETRDVSTRTARRWISAVLGPNQKGGSVDDR